MASPLAQLRSVQSSLTPVLERIAAYALSHPHKVIYHTVTELAEASGTSEASVIRFCRDLGYAGFQDFKLALAVDLASHPVAPSDD
jgi:DNA-binding MurR/RpiR family transcriptional regulator